MIRRPPRSTQSRSSAASDVYKRQQPQQSRSHPPRRQRLTSPQVRGVVRGHWGRRIDGWAALLSSSPAIRSHANASQVACDKTKSVPFGLACHATQSHAHPAIRRQAGCGEVPAAPADRRGFRGRRIGNTVTTTVNAFWATAPDAPLSKTCLLYTSPSPRDRTRSRMPSSA